MSITIERLRPFLLKPHINESVLVNRIHKFQDHYTIARDKLKQVKWDEFDVSSYTCFYLATNYQKFSFVKNFLPDDFFIPSPGKKIEVIDMGTGPGTFLLAFLDEMSKDGAFDEDHYKRFVGVDKSELMLKQAQSLLHGLYPHIKNKIVLTDHVFAEEGDVERIVIFGNSINEMDNDYLEKQLKALNAHKIIFIEPGTPLVYNKLMKLRSYFKNTGHQCFYPCPSLDFACPIERKVEEGKMDWCHQVWRGKHSDCVERLSQLAKIDRKVMPLIAHVYGRQETLKEEKNSARFVRFLGESKHSFNWQVCLVDEGESQLVCFEIPKKAMSKGQVKEFKRMSVGLEATFHVTKKIDSHKWRVEIKTVN